MESHVDGEWVSEECVRLNNLVNLENALSAYFINQECLLTKKVLSIKATEEVDVPWALDLHLLRLCFAISTDVDQVVGVVVEGFVDDEWSFPWRRQLVHTFGILNQAQDQVALLEGTSAYSAAVVAAEPLLVDGGTGEC